MQIETNTPIVSPCVRKCTLDQKDICIGCGRSLAEIKEWSSANRARQFEIVDASAARLADLSRG